jgi:ElaB/YqjD/DUF883 family membrane-anchored ribosome-binding protein
MADTPKPGTGDIEAQMRKLGDEIAKLTDLLARDLKETASDAKGKVGAKAEALSRAAHAAAEGMSERAKGELHEIERKIAEKPVQSAIIAFLAGLLIGGILRR